MISLPGIGIEIGIAIDHVPLGVELLRTTLDDSSDIAAVTAPLLRIVRAGSHGQLLQGAYRWIESGACAAEIGGTVYADLRTPKSIERSGERVRDGNPGCHLRPLGLVAIVAGYACCQKVWVVADIWGVFDDLRHEIRFDVRSAGLQHFLVGGHLDRGVDRAR